MTVTDEAVDLAMAAMPDRRIRLGRSERAEVHRMLEAAEPVLCAAGREHIRQQLGGSVERVHRLRHAYEQVDDHPDVLLAFAQLENDLSAILRQTH